ncbi:MAG: hypothetical protein VX345_14865, partial [Pseudomonadota bacterium]|nr:hypothetical protein [Pseudomonadota bacterium]
IGFNKEFFWHAFTQKRGMAARRDCGGGPLADDGMIVIRRATPCALTPTDMTFPNKVENTISGR